jgi:hypothetical protein
MTTWSHDEVKDLYARAESAEMALLALVVEVYEKGISEQEMPKALPQAVKVLLNCQMKAVSEHPLVKNLRLLAQAVVESSPPGE